MQESVRRAWTQFIRKFEGYCTWIYLDTHDPTLPTTGIGNLMGTHDALSDFGKSLPFRHTNEDYATEKQITDEFKRLRDLNLSGSGYAYQKYATLFLDDYVVEEIVENKLLSNEEVLVNYFPKFKEWPANAQLAVSNMAWLMGPAFAGKGGSKWPNFYAAINSGDFARAAELCKDKDGWDKPRNLINRDNLRWASIVDRNGMDKGVLWTSAPVVPLPPVTRVTVTVSAVKQALTGTVNEAGRVIQTALKGLGYYKLAIDGQCGTYTKAAIKAFCLREKLDENDVGAWLAALSMESNGFWITQ